MTKYEAVNEYINNLEGQQKEWVLYFVNYMRKYHPELEEVISFKMPTFKLGSGKLRNYIAFAPAKYHFSMHTMDFEYVEILKGKLSKAGDGKGCVKVKYTNPSERKILTQAIDEIVKRKVLSTYGK